MILEWLREDINSLFKDYRVVLFFDPQEDYKEIIEKLEGDFKLYNVKEESLLKIKYEIEYSPPEKKFLIYLPSFSSDKPKNLSYLREYLYSGGKFDQSLYMYLKRKGVKFPTDKKKLVEIKKSLPSLALDSIGKGREYWDNLFEKKEEDIIIHNFDEKLLEFIRDPHKTIEELKAYNKLEAFAKKIESEFGYIDDFSDPFKARFDFIARLCFTELYILSGKPENYPFRQLILKTQNIEKSIKLLDKLRDSAKYKEIYKEISFEIEEKYNIISFAKNNAFKPNIKTFITFDKVAFHLINEKISQIDNKAQFIDTFEMYSDFIKAKEQSFWSREGEITSWEALKKVCEFIECYKSFIESSPSVENYIKKYYKIDKLYREYLYTVYEEVGLEELTQWINKLYINFLDKLNTYFTEMVASGGISLESMEHQKDFLKKVKLKDRGKVAIIIVDALRYDLGKELESRLSRNFKVKLQPMISHLPTVTEIGMAFLLSPENPEIKCDIQKLRVLDGGYDLSTKKGRKKYMKSKNKSLHFLELNEINTVPIKELSKIRSPIIVFSREIDEFGEIGGVDSIKFFSDLLSGLIKGVKKLAKAGFSEIYIVTDHGFLSFEDPERRFKIADKPGLPSSNKRYVLGTHIEDENLIRMDLPYLHGKSLYFPRSIFYFRASTFLHGGISIQEMIIPYLKIISKKSIIPRFEIKIEMEGGIYNKLFEVKLKPKGEQLTLGEKTIEVIAFKGDMRISNKPAVTIGKETSVLLRIINTENLTRGDTIKIIARDQETKEILDEVERELMVEFDELDL